jgi:hypothetical protein
VARAFIQVHILFPSIILSFYTSRCLHSLISKNLWGYSFGEVGTLDTVKRLGNVRKSCFTFISLSGSQKASENCSFG